MERWARSVFEVRSAGAREWGGDWGRERGGRRRRGGGISKSREAKREANTKTHLPRNYRVNHAGHNQGGVTRGVKTRHLGRPGRR